MKDSIKETLYRVVNERLRYYKLSAYKTLFHEYLLIIEYGSAGNKKPTGLIQEYFSSKEKLIQKRSQIIEQKKKKGYRQ